MYVRTGVLKKTQQERLLYFLAGLFSLTLWDQRFLPVGFPRCLVFCVCDKQYNTYKG